MPECPDDIGGTAYSRRYHGQAMNRRFDHGETIRFDLRRIDEDTPGLRRELIKSIRNVPAMAFGKGHLAVKVVPIDAVRDVGQNASMLRLPAFQIVTLSSQQDQVRMLAKPLVGTERFDQSTQVFLPDWPRDSEDYRLVSIL